MIKQKQSKQSKQKKERKQGASKIIYMNEKEDEHNPSEEIADNSDPHHIPP